MGILSWLARGKHVRAARNRWATLTIGEPMILNKELP
ncbi:hypothetical protein LMG28138_02219 [Pararobbsia alpina]|uniref:Uncharacterized protein n=1 Tax=Pararobbsia alpina TaxID=621374 RepID=A0A6S7BCE9_9BURK|nr:hypothetical protein LMG28138_02219 [Pararobbsia alpina]